MRKIACVTAGICALAACVSDVPSAMDGGLDSGTDTSVAGDAAPDVRTFCSDVDATFCEDFDRSTALPGTPTITNNFGLLTVDPQSFKSPPASLSNAVYPTDAGGFAAAIDRFDALTGGARHVVVDFDWRVDTLSNGAIGGDLDVFVVRADGFAGGAAIHLLPTSDAGVALSFGPAFAALRLPTIGTWEHVRMEVTWPSDGGTGAIATVQVGNDAPVTASITHPQPQSTFNLLAGAIRINNGNPSTPRLSHRLDNVIIRAL